MTRVHDAGQLTTGELEIARRQLRRPWPDYPRFPAHAPILALMQAIDAELAGRTGGRQTGKGQRPGGAMLPRPAPSHCPASRDFETHEPSARAGLDTEQDQSRCLSRNDSRPCRRCPPPGLPATADSRPLPQALRTGTAAVPADARLPS
jgi:hypothetical protein